MHAMTRPTRRVLAVLELLQARGRISGAQLARELEVDTRTVRRYIAHLEDLGIPITATRGRDGSYALVPGFRLPPLMFDDDEALALALGLRVVRSIGLDTSAPSVASAQAKLERVLPGNLRRRIGALDETVSLELAQPVAAFDPVLLATLSAATQQRQRVRLVYRSPQGESTERAFDAYGLVWRVGRWYVLGHCHLRRAVRSFRLDRIVACEALPAAFARPDGFDALAHLHETIARLPRAFAVEVVLETDIATARVELFSTFGVLEPVASGVRLRAQAESLAWFARELARLPFGWRIVGPEALREAVRDVARALVRRARG